MANLNKVVYLSEAQKNTLFTNGSITINGTTVVYNDNDLYITPSAIDQVPVQNSNNLITSGAVYSAIENVRIHTLTFGSGTAAYVFDGTEDVTVPVYTGTGTWTTGESTSTLTSQLNGNT